MIHYPLPVLGFCAYSGTGKTTLLAQVIPLLKSRGLRIGVVKHAHHSFDMDHAGKDSFKLRGAGADQMLVASRNRIAWIRETPEQEREPSLSEILTSLDNSHLDLVLVEGFKQAPFPKIELHRPRLGKPLIYPRDPNVIAIASDEPQLRHATGIHTLDLNRPEEIVDFIEQKLLVANRLDTGSKKLRVLV